MEQHYDHINRLLQSSDVTDNLGALRGIDELIDVPPGENASNISKISNFLRDMFEAKRDPEILILASIVLGHLARSGGAMAADEVERQVNDALDWLRGERVYHRRLGAVLILKEMAENASTVFNVHISEFVEVIWTALCDPNLDVRERAVDALRACLRVIEKRETRWRVQWYFQMFEATQDGLIRNSPVHSIHGSLLAVGELLRNTGDFMMPRYREVADIVVKYVGHRDRLVRLSITSLLPRIAHFLPDRFVTSHLQICMNHIITVLRIPAERSSGFVALGEMAGALGAELTEYLPTIMSHIREAITSRKGRSSLDALACAGNLAKAMGSTMEAYVNGLLDVMFSAGLSVTLVAALEKISTSIESQIPVIQNRLRACILKALSLPHSSQSRAPTFLPRAHSMNNPTQSADISDSATVQLALQTLGHFNFQGHELLEFGKETVILYLDDVDAATRKDAALCCCRLISNFFSSLSGAQFSSVKLNRALGKRRRLIEEIVEKLLTSAVSDEDVAVRYSILSSLEADKGFDDFLAQADSLVAVFAALNDEDFKVRECAISVAGRLSEKNPAYVLPALRGHLILLLTYLGQSSDNKCKEESAKLLGCLIRNCERLILPYIAPVHKVLLAKLCESSGINANNGFVCGILVTVGDLARVGGFAMRQYIPELMPLIVEALLDGAVVSKRELAVTTLGQVVQSTGYVISPYQEFPQLLGVLLKLLNGDLAWSTRREVLKVIGIMGAVDPHAHKLNPQSLSGSHGEVGRAVGGSGQHSDELSADFWPSVVSSEDYFSTVAISSLMLILKDPSSSSYHPKVVGSLMFIFKSMGLGCVPYLSKVLPELFLIVRTCEGSLKEFITLKLGTLVSVVRQHIRKYMPELLPLISELWRSSFTLPSTSCQIPVLHLVEELCLALNDEFRTYTTDIFPLCIQVLSEAERSNDYSYVVAILHTLEVFGGTLDEHMHLLLPILTRLLKTDVPSNIRLAIIKTLTKLIPRVQVVGHVSSLVHQFKLVLDGNDNDLRKEAVDALCCLAHGLGHDFNIFIPSIHRLLFRHGVHHKEFEEIKGWLQRREPLIFCSKATKISDRQLPVRMNSNLQNDIVCGPHELVCQGQFRNSQNKEFVGIEGLSQRREPHVYGRKVSQIAGRQLPVEISSDIPSEIDNYPHEFVSDGQFGNYQINEERLLAAGDASQRSTTEDWTEWMRHFSLELLRVSPSPALSSCASLAQLQPSLGRELFSVSYASCWAKIPHSCQEKLVRSFEIAFSSPTIPPEILASLLNLAEFMEHDEKPLPIDIRLLTALSEKCGALAKSLHYKELEFQRDHSESGVPDPVAIESLIHINNQLQQHEAALGILTYAQESLGIQLKESWYEKLQRWEDVLKIYTAKASHESNPSLALDATLGRMRCLAALARWEELNNLCKEYWAPSEQSTRLEMASMAASAAWNMGEWDLMESHVSRLEEGVETMPRGLGNSCSSGDSSTNVTFFKAVLCVRRGKYDDAHDYIERTRKCLATELAALVLESYERSYSNMVRVQQLAELEEVIDYCTLPVGNTIAESRRALIRNMWTDRIHGAKHNVEVWQSLLAVRTLVLPPTEDIDIWLKFASLCRKHGRINHARSTLIKLLQYDPERSQNVRYCGPPQVMLGYLKFQWSLGEDSRRRETFLKLMDLAGELSSSSSMILGQGTTTNSMNPNNPLLARMYHCLGTWQWALSPTLDDDSIQEICNSFWNATQFAGKWEKGWHSWALFNTAVLSHYSSRGSSSTASPFVVAAVTGYFHSIACSANAKGVDDSLQDILRLLTLWFNHGDTADVQMALQKGFSYVNINTWLAVLPQIIARIHSNNKSVKELIQSLLVTIGQSHPQALMYPLLVACKSVSNLRSAAAQEVVDKVRQHSGILVDQAHLVSKELIRVAILWHEMWHEALEEASRFYFGEHDIEGMLNVLEPLHVMLEEGAMATDATLKEKAFIQAYRHELLEAYESCMKYKRTGKDAELTQAWDLYYHVFKRIDKQLQSLTTLDLQSASPALMDCRDFQLAVPGTYRAESPVVTIASFAPQLEVITSKQRPRKLTIHGSDGEDYTFLLKGHEDLRQDERVMQLFGLANTLLSNSRKTAEKDLSIQRYAVIPLSPNSGLIGWVPNCDTLHYLIREYRDSRKIVLNQEHKCMLSLSPDYDHLPLLGKVEVFEYALQNTPGNDLSQVLWLKSRTSEIWLDRRTNYTRSLAVMSMVGYLLGLGDRHPSNLMLHRYSGKILHIDFGDCFEASMNREKFPEKVPFRLTRMLVKAMEISGIEGNFRSTCENVMQVLRTNKDSVMAMMEAFVHDPLINWRLFNINEVPRIANSASNHTPAPVNLEDLAQNKELAQPLRGARERELLQAVNQLGDANDVLNERAVFVMARMSNKLTGRDFSTSCPTQSSVVGNQHALLDHNSMLNGEVEHGLSVKLQVQKLIVQAMSHENLCQNYVGWCPFW